MRCFHVLSVLVCLSLASPAFGAEFKVYPGAKVDQKATQELEKAKGQAPQMTAGLEASFCRPYLSLEGGTRDVTSIAVSRQK